MDHAVAIGADKGKIRQFSLGSRFHFRDWYSVMALNKSLPAFTIGLCKIKTTGFTMQATVLLQELFLLVVYDFPIALSITVESRYQSPLGRVSDFRFLGVCHPL